MKDVSWPAYTRRLKVRILHPPPFDAAWQTSNAPGCYPVPCRSVTYRGSHFPSCGLTAKHPTDNREIQVRFLAGGPFAFHPSRLDSSRRRAPV